MTFLHHQPRTHHLPRQHTLTGRYTLYFITQLVCLYEPLILTGFWNVRHSGNRLLLVFLSFEANLNIQVSVMPQV